MLPTDYKARKDLPIFDGVLMYFPDAIAAVAAVSAAGNAQHNPGEKLHWAREKSTDQMNTSSATRWTTAWVISRTSMAPTTWPRRPGAPWLSCN